MAAENISREFRLKNIDETRNSFLEEIEQNELISRKPKKICTTLNFIEHFLNLAPTVTGHNLTSDFASLLCIPIRNSNRIKILCNSCRN